MRTEEPRPVRLAEYRPPEWLIERVLLEVTLHPTATRVRSQLEIRPNPAATEPVPLVLDGDELRLISVQLDGVELPAEQYAATPDRLSIAQPPRGPFRLEIETEVDPTGNTKLMGLYRSSGTYCTQCEAEGFRRITYFLDRPDVMAVYTTRIEADKTEAPVLLGNGNKVDGGQVPGTNRHFAVWHDPFPKPSYLFALVGGNLGSVEDHFRTGSGRDVVLQIFVEPGKEHRAAYAMDSLKRAMRWDEEAFGREYDLDIFMIVAVSDFNMGAMENKGLNVFNDKYVLASPETATDGDFASIEAIVAHEYFHNWTGNRITCRDWFQLCLKEGLTVFRDQEFTADQRSRPVKRIADVRVLRAQQFVEDAGPLAHPVRPTAYHEINNFYTATVYEKGAEIVRMLKVLLGADRFRAGMDLYFERHDGEAATVEQFIQCFADASGRDLEPFMRWYEQAGTPHVAVSGHWDAGTRTYRLEATQSVPPTPGQSDKGPMVIPLAIGLLDDAGRDLPLTTRENGPLPDGVVALTQNVQVFNFEGMVSRPIPSFNRGFSAPIRLIANQSRDELCFLAAHDSDPFNRWQAVQSLATELLRSNAAAWRRGEPLRTGEGLTDALRAVVADPRLDPAFVALALTLPSESDIAREIERDVDPDAISAAREPLRAHLGNALRDHLHATFERMRDDGPYSPDAASAGRRSLKNVCLDLLTATKAPEAIALATEQFETADNMTDRMGSLGALATHDVPERSRALDALYARYAADPLVIDKWLAVQATIPERATLDRVEQLTAHPAFSFANPNRVRALIGAFAQGNQRQFNRPDGAGYRFVSGVISMLDERNPQLAARLMGAFRSWRALEPSRRAKAEAVLREMARKPSLSRDLADIVRRALSEEPA